MSRQAHRCKVALHAFGFGCRGKLASGRKVERADHAERDRLPMQQAIRKTGSRLEGVPEGMAEIEQRPFAGLALVAPDGLRFGATTHRDRVLARRPASENLAPAAFEP